MTSINPLSGAQFGVSSSLQKTGSNIASVIAGIASGQQGPQDVANTSIATTLQSQVSVLRQVAGNSAQASAETQTASGAITQLQDINSQLQQLAAQAASAQNGTDRQALNAQAQQLVKQHDEIVSSANFNGQPLLNGTYSADLGHVLGTGDAGVSLNIPDLSSGAVIGGGIDLGTQAGAQAALGTLQNAANTLQTAQANVGGFGQALEFTAANIDTAVANQQAANSQLSDTDIASASTALAQLLTQQNAQIAVAAQANKLSSSVLDLINKPVA